MTDKPTLRRQVLAARDAFIANNPPPVQVPEAFRARLSHGLTVTSFVPFGSEIDPSPLARAAVDAGCVLALPHITVRSEPMRFLAWETEAALEAGPFGLRQPAADAAELLPDIILTPLVAFDAKLDRLGHGAGYYDRAFARFPDAWRVGVAWSVQHVAALPVESWDVPLSRGDHRIRMDPPMTPPPKPRWQKPVGVLLILLMLVIWCIAVVSLSPWGQPQAGTGADAVLSGDGNCVAVDTANAEDVALDGDGPVAVESCPK